MPPTIPKASAVVEAARRRRPAAAAAQNVRSEWFIDEVVGLIELNVRQRVHLASEYLKGEVVRNISRPVTKGPGGYVTDRSKPDEFPKADTTQLMKSIFTFLKDSSSTVVDGFVGTPLHYGVILETRMRRSFLLRTFREETDRVKRILTAPKRGFLSDD